MLDRQPRRPFSHAELDAARPELLEKRVGDERREALEQVEPPRVAELADLRGHVRVVDRVRQVVVGPALAHVELHVEEEDVPVAPLVLVGAVVAEDLQAAQFDDHPRTARAAARASTCSRTSWARMIVAPWSNAATAAPTDADVVPTLESRPRIFASEFLREKPIRMGRPIATSSSRRRTSSKLCSTVFPKPMPGSRHTSSSRMPASTAAASRSSRKRLTSDTTSS